MDSKRLSDKSPFNTSAPERDSKEDKANLERRYERAMDRLGAIVKPIADEKLTLEEEPSMEGQARLYDFNRTWSVPVVLDGKTCQLDYYQNYNLCTDETLSLEPEMRLALDKWLSDNNEDTAKPQLCFVGYTLVDEDVIITSGVCALNPFENSDIDQTVLDETSDCAAFKEQLEYLEEFIALLRFDIEKAR